MAPKLGTPGLQAGEHVRGTPLGDWAAEREAAHA